MRRSLLLIPAFLLLTSSSFYPARAEENPKPDDQVEFDISAEDWVTTKTARVMVSVEAAVNGAAAGGARADMTKSVNDLAKAEWRLTSFNRSQDQSGLERWSAVFEARLPETALNGLADAAKKESKAGMQLSIASIDFSPTLAEMEAARAGLRTQIYKDAAGQLTALNAALPGRNYRIASIDFTGGGGHPLPRVIKGMPMNMMMEAAPAGAPASLERAEKITLTARIVFAASPK